MSNQPEIPHGMDARAVTTFDDARKIAWKFEKLLTDCGIAIPNKWWLAEAILELNDMEEKRLGRVPIDTTDDIRPMQRRIVGLLDLMSRIMRASDRGRIGDFESHLPLLTACEFAQNMKFAGGWGQAIAEEKTNKVFELLIALACGELGSNLVLDPPDVLKSVNPDVLVTIGGKRWGFPCKVVYGQNPRSFLDNVIKGVDQIEKSEATIGIVVINLKNVIQHDDFWPILRYDGKDPVFGSWKHEDFAFEHLKKIASDWHAGLVDETTEDELKSVFDKKKALPGALLFLQTTTAVTKEGKPVPTNLGILSLMRFGPIAQADETVLERLNAALRNR